MRDGEGSSSYTRRELRRSYPLIIEDNIVGLKSEIEKLVSVLVDEESSNFQVASICGMGGSAKPLLLKGFTTIPKFEVISSALLGSMFLSNSKEENERGSKLSDEELEHKLFNFLKERKRLVIIDDIWSTQARDILKAAFPMGDDKSSKILLNSSNKDGRNQKLEV
ncbi:hypothetical protein DITRI_Ditri01bG0185500 [Diplodiscus trichospermus]